MPKFLYDNNDNAQTRSVEETEKTADAGPSVTTPLGVEEEFDISSFDFTIADPGEIAEFSDASEFSESSKGDPSAEVPSGQREKNAKAFSKLFSTLSEKTAKLMEETPREPKIREKKEKPVKEHRPVRDRKETPMKSENNPFRTGTSKVNVERIHFTGGSVAQVSRRWMRYALRPSTLYDSITERLWPLFLVGVMLFFGGFYLLIGLDWYFAHLISIGRLWVLVGIGLLVGGTAAMAFGAGTQGLSLICRKERLRPFRVISAVAGACVYPSLLLILGLLIQVIFQVSVSMSFGVMGVLWMICILLDVLRDLFEEKNLFKSTVLIVLWGFILFVIMTLTFTLK